MIGRWLTRFNDHSTDWYLRNPTAFGDDKTQDWWQNWLTTPTQPIAVDDVLAYLLAVKDLSSGESRIFEIGCEDVTTYGGMVREYAHQQGLRRWLIFVPVLTPYLSSLWLALVTPASFEVGRHLIEGLKNPTVVQDQKALDVFTIRPMGVQEAIQMAIASTAA